MGHAGDHASKSAVKKILYQSDGGDERTISIPGCVGQGDTVGKPRLFVCSGAGVWPRFARARQDPPTPSLVSPFGGC